MTRRSVAVLGAIGLLPIAWGLVQHTVSIPEAAKRATILLVALWLIERVMLPLLGPMLAPPRDRPDAVPGDVAPERTAAT